MSCARYQLSELHCCSFVRSLACLPAGLLALYSLFRSLYHLSFSRSLSLLAYALFTCVISTLGQRWTLSNRKHRFSLWLYRTRQSKGKSCQISFDIFSGLFLFVSANFSIFLFVSVNFLLFYIHFRIFL